MIMHNTDLGVFQGIWSCKSLRLYVSLCEYVALFVCACLSVDLSVCIFLCVCIS